MSNVRPMLSSLELAERMLNVDGVVISKGKLQSKINYWLLYELIYNTKTLGWCRYHYGGVTTSNNAYAL